MLSHPDDFMPFLPSPTGEDSEGATEDGLITEKGFHKYCQLVAESGEWGGEPEVSLRSRYSGRQVEAEGWLVSDVVTFSRA